MRVLPLPPAPAFDFHFAEFHESAAPFRRWLGQIRPKSEVGAVAESQWAANFILERDCECARVTIAATSTAIVANGLKLETAERALADPHAGILADRRAMGLWIECEET